MFSQTLTLGRNSLNLPVRMQVHTHLTITVLIPVTYERTLFHIIF
uniref:Uncharacterized protein n=1 Tax=Anguilla anguilla TaxID=7936 RepID=A0A0E9PTC1_ANGAN